MDWEEKQKLKITVDNINKNFEDIFNGNIDEKTIEELKENKQILEEFYVKQNERCEELYAKNGGGADNSEAIELENNLIFIKEYIEDAQTYISDYEGDSNSKMQNEAEEKFENKDDPFSGLPEFFEPEIVDEIEEEPIIEEIDEKSIIDDEIVEEITTSIMEEETEYEEIENFEAEFEPTNVMEEVNEEPIIDDEIVEEITASIMEEEPEYDEIEKFEEEFEPANVMEEVKEDPIIDDEIVEEITNSIMEEETEYDEIEKIEEEIEPTNVVEKVNEEPIIDDEIVEEITDSIMKEKNKIEEIDVKTFSFEIILNRQPTTENKEIAKTIVNRRGKNVKSVVQASVNTSEALGNKLGFIKPETKHTTNQYEYEKEEEKIR